MFALKSIVLAFVAIASIEANLIYKIRVNTADCDDCGMSNTFGALRLQVTKRIISNLTEPSTILDYR